MNRITQIFLLLALLLPATASAYDFVVDGIYYYIDGNNAIVTYQQYVNYSYQSDYSGDVTIPETVTYNGTTYSVTTIGNDAFCGCSGLTSVNIPNSVTTNAKKFIHSNKLIFSYLQNEFHFKSIC